MVTMQTNHGEIKIALDAEKAPVTVANFIKYAKQGFYDGTIFHRVIKDFMIQGGGHTEDMEPKKGDGHIKNEADNGLTNEVGTIAMARTNDPHSACAQFFINTKDNSFLNFASATPSGWGYCVFGKVVEGMDIVDKISNVTTDSRLGHQDVPRDAVIIEKVTIDE